MKKLKDIVTNDHQRGLSQLYDSLINIRTALTDIAIEKTAILQNAHVDFKELIETAQHMELNRIVEEKAKQMKAEVDKDKEAVDKLHEEVKKIKKEYF